MTKKIIKHMKPDEYRVIRVPQEAVIELFKDIVKWDLEHHFELLTPKPWHFGWYRDTDDCIFVIHEDWKDDVNLDGVIEALSHSYTTSSIYNHPSYRTVYHLNDGNYRVDQILPGKKRRRTVKHLKASEYRVMYVSRTAIREVVFDKIQERIELYFGVCAPKPCFIKWDEASGDLTAIVCEQMPGLADLEQVTKQLPYTTSSFTACEYPPVPKFKIIRHAFRGNSCSDDLLQTK